MSNIVMGRGELKAYLCNVIEFLDDASYKGFCELFLTACGVIDQNGNLTPEYADSPYWKVEDGVLSPNASAVKRNEAGKAIKKIMEGENGAV